MQFQQDEKTYFIHLEKDEPVIKTLTQFCIDHKIENGQLSGIGALKNIELGAYLLNKKEYVKNTFEEIHELVSAQGNVTLKEGNPFIHLHICIGYHDFSTKAGHLFEANVGIIGEFILRKIDTQVCREMNNDIGLATCRC